VQVVTHRKTNKRGKPVGKATLVGFNVDYSTAMAASAGNSADYQIEALVRVKRVKKAKVPVYKAIGVTATYNASTDSVLLTLAGVQTFPKGGQITVITAPPSGVASFAGVFLGGVTQFTVSAGAHGVTPQ
jgi:hypothetical protein